ncbi:MAG: SEC-C metal-binding domain-containing protein [Deltaproteobacteria bacterium]|nr:SEC-C metal-binding domain-containing protein [Deltaproteobacteria bacterium]
MPTRVKKVGRNDPCPCLSGKKYKKCCYGKEIFSGNDNPLESGDPVLPDRKEIDYGIPALGKEFFRRSRVHGISAPRLLYSSLLRPEVEKLASDFTNRVLDRGAKEARMIEKTDDAKGLVEIMRKGLDPLNYERLKEKLLKYQELSIPLIFDELKKPQDDAFVELAVRVIHASGKDWAREALEIIQHQKLTAYTASLLCMLLGFYEREKSEKVLWDYYHYLRNHFPDETYSDGPLLGLIEMRERERERSLEQGLNGKIN